MEFNEVGVVLFCCVLLREFENEAKPCNRLKERARLLSFQSPGTTKRDMIMTRLMQFNELSEAVQLLLDDLQGMAGAMRILGNEAVKLECTEQKLCRTSAWSLWEGAVRGRLPPVF